MKRYTVYFEIFGKKMKHTTVAVSYDQAKQIIKDKIIFHAVDVNHLSPGGSIFDTFFKK